MCALSDFDHPSPGPLLTFHARVLAALAERAKAARRPQYDVDRIARLPPAPRQAFVHATSMNRHPHPMSAQRLPRGAQRGGPPFGRGLGPAESFVVLSESTIVKSQPPTAQPDGKPSGSEPDSGPQTQPIAKLTRLYNLLSTVSEIDHPLCIECGDFLMERMGKQLENAKLDRQRYKHFESEVAQERITEAETVKALQAEVSKVGFFTLWWLVSKLIFGSRSRRRDGLRPTNCVRSSPSGKLSNASLKS